MLRFLCRALSDDSTRQDLFEEYVALLQQKAKEKERKREEEKVTVSDDRSVINFFFFINLPGFGVNKKNVRGEGKSLIRNFKFT